MPLPSNKSAQQLRSAADRTIDSTSRATTESELQAFDVALAQRQKLDSLLSTSPQLNAFRAANGIDWSERFVSVESFRRSIPLFGYQGVKLVEHLWNNLPASKFKRFQEAFCEKSDYCVPRPNVAAPCVQYPSAAELNRCSLSACLVSPARIPFKLLVDLGIVTEPKNTLTDIEALEIKSDPRVVAALKAVWEAAEPLGATNQRFLVIQQVDTAKYPEATALTEDKLGCLLNIRENTSVQRVGTKRDRSQWQAPKQIPSFFSSVYNALRSTDHESISYALETTSIEHLSQEWNDVTQRARQHWRATAPADIKDALRAELVTLVSRSREELKGVSHELKKEAADAFTQLEKRLQDGSNNITTHVTTVEAAVRKLQQYLDTVDRKTGHNTTDQSILIRTIQSAHQNFALVSNSLYGASCRLADDMSTKKEGYFNQKHISTAARETAATTALTRLRIPINAITSIGHQPLRLFAQRIRGAYAELQNALIRQDAPAAKRALVKIVALTKIQRAHDVFEELRRYTVRGEVVPLKQLARSASSLRNLLVRRAIFEDTVIEEYQTAYEAIEQRVKILAMGLERHNKKGLDLSQRAVMYSKLRVFLDEADLIEIIRKLPE